MSSYSRPPLSITIKNYLYLLFTGLSKTKCFYVHRCGHSEDDIIRYLPKKFYTHNENLLDENIDSFKSGCNGIKFLFTRNENNYYTTGFLNYGSRETAEYIIKFQQNGWLKINYNFHEDNYSGEDLSKFSIYGLASICIFFSQEFPNYNWIFIFIVGFFLINICKNINQRINYNRVKRNFEFFIFLLSSYKNKTLKIE